MHKLTARTTVLLLTALLLSAPAFARHLPAETIAEKAHVGFKFLSGAKGEILGCRFLSTQDSNKEVVVFAGFKYARTNGTLSDLGEAPRVEDGVLMCPESLLGFLQVLQGPVHKAPGARKTYLVVIDAGHGGKDPGAVGRNGLREKDANLGISLHLAKILKQRGVSVLLTRANDTFLELSERAAIVNESGCDLFLCIHANAVGGNPSVQGHMALVPNDDWRNADLGNATERAMAASKKKDLNLNGIDSRALSPSAAATLYGVIVEQNRQLSFAAASAINAAIRSNMRTADRGTKPDPRGLHVLKNTFCPAVLVEVDFLSNPTVERRLATDTYRQRLASAMADGVLDFLHENMGKDE